MMETEKNKENAKQTYQKPQLRTIELVAEEVLAIGCKLVGGGSPDVLNPINCHAPTFCAQKGS